jgi:hypothetical protein
MQIAVPGAQNVCCRNESVVKFVSKATQGSRLIQSCTAGSFVIFLISLLSSTYRFSYVTFLCCSRTVRESLWLNVLRDHAETPDVHMKFL